MVRCLFVVRCLRLCVAVNVLLMCVAFVCCLFDRSFFFVLLFVVCSLLCVVCRALCVVCRLLCVVSYLLFVVGGSLFVVCCLFVVRGSLLFVA